MNESDVRIGEVVSEFVITEGIGPLSPQEVKALVAVVLEQLRQQQDLRADRERDTAIHDRVFRSTVA
jgi:hypothetical protein